MCVIVVHVCLYASVLMHHTTCSRFCPAKRLPGSPSSPLQAPSFPAPLPEEGEATIEQPSHLPAPLVIMAIHDLPRRHTVSPGPVAGGPERAAHPVAPRHRPVSYTHLRAHETKANLVCRLLLEKKKKKL